MAQAQWQDIRAIHKEFKHFYRIGGGVTLLVIGVLIGYMAFGVGEGYLTNVFTEALFFIGTVLVLDRLNEYRAEKALQKRLVREAGSQSNETAKAAIDWMRAEGWLTVDDDVQLLRGANLEGANLEKAKLEKASLVGVQLIEATLQDCKMRYANLDNAILVKANLTRVEFDWATLRKSALTMADARNANFDVSDLNGAILTKANLANATFSRSNLIGAELTNANIKSASFAGHFGNAIFDETTILPDGTNYDPELGIEQMKRFTDPEHPEFWQPDWVKEQGD